MLKIEFQKYSRTVQAKLTVLMQYNENNYNMTYARINEINYCLHSTSRSIQEQVKQSFVLMQYNENKRKTLGRINDTS